MLETFKNVSSLLLGYALMIMANALFNTLLGIRMELEDFGATVTGFVMSAYFLGLLIGARYVSRVIARVGHIRCFGLFASIISIVVLVHILWVNPWVWAVMRVTSGFCMAGMITITESWLNSRTDNEHRGQVLSWYMITNYGAAGLGQFLLPLADPGEFVLFCLISILFSAALVPVMITKASAPKPSPPSRVSIVYLYRVAPLACIATMGSGIMNANFYALAPVFTQRIGMALHETSTFMAVSVMSGMVLQWPLGRLSDRIGRARVLAGIGTVTASACFAIAFLSLPAGVWLYLIAAVYGGAVFTVYSVASAQANDMSGPDNRVMVAGSLLIAFGIGAIAGPVVGGLAMRTVGPGGLFGLNGIIATLIALYALKRSSTLRGRRILGRFLPAPGTQFTSGLLYRRVRNQIDSDLRRYGQYSGRRF
ncbi:MAG: MFS transporter [Arenicellales bacterium]|jgi:MFS family permease